MQNRGSKPDVDPSTTEGRSRLSAHMREPADEIRLNRQWLAIASRLPSSAATSAAGASHVPAQRPLFAWLRPLAVGLAAAGIAVGAYYGIPDDQAGPSALQHAVLESERGPIMVALSDGSHVKLAEASRLQVRSDRPENIALELERGSAFFSVRPDTTRHFAVVVEGVEVRVVGTAFTVARQTSDQGTRVEVEVTEGIVEIRTADLGVRRLGAGESFATWTEGGPDADAAAFATETPEEKTSETEQDEADANDEPSGSDAAQAPVATGVPAAAKPLVTGQSLFEQALSARRNGDFEGAARLYERLLHEFPNDPRAGLAALELGRLRADSLGDEAGAADAFEQAAGLSQGSGLEQDALYRMVLVRDEQGDIAGCKQARAQYLKHYPEGPYAAVVKSSCMGAAKP